MSTASMSDAAELRVLHWNIHSWTDESGNSNLDRVAALITATEPHVVSLVEVNEPTTGPSTLHRLASDTAYHSVFVPAFEFGGDQPHGQFGNVLLSRIPLLDVRHHQLLWPPRAYGGTEPSEPRSLLLGRFQADVGPVWVGTTHLPATDHVARDNAARRALAIMSARSIPWLLVGDFNAAIVPSRHGYPSLRAYPEPALATYPTSAPTECIDYCIAPQGLRIDVRTVEVTGSDHLPIIVQFRSSGEGRPP